MRQEETPNPESDKITRNVLQRFPRFCSYDFPVIVLFVEIKYNEFLVML